MEFDLRKVWEKGNLGRTDSQSKNTPGQIIFSKVLEDPAVEQLILSQATFNTTPQVFCIASGGCTVFSLIATQPMKMVTCDINLAQIALVELKASILSDINIGESDLYQAFYKSGIDAHQKVKNNLSEETKAFWNQHISLLNSGLQSCGVIDKKMALAMKPFHWFIHSKKRIAQIASFETLEKQSQFVNTIWKSSRWNACFKWLLNRKLLRLVYGASITNSLPNDFSKQIQDQVEAGLTTHLCADNPYFKQTFLPNKPPTQKDLPTYLLPENTNCLRANLKDLTIHTGDALSVIASSPTPFDFFDLSNILEVNHANYSTALAHQIATKSTPKAIVLLRFIFTPSAEILQPFHQYFQLDRALTTACQKADKSLFCRNIYVFRLK